jgi:hypothetical protein
VRILVKVGRVCNTHGREEGYMQVSGRKIGKKGTTRKFYKREDNIKMVKLYV